MDPVKETIKAYDRNARQHADYSELFVMQYEWNKFVSLLQGKRILDAGCGSGRDMRYFLGEKFRPFGIDLSFAMLKEAKNRGKGVYLQMGMAKLGFKDKCFDGVWCQASLLHLPKKDALYALKEFYRVLRGKGALFIGVKEGEGEGFQESPSLPNEKRFFSFYSQLEIEGILEEHGFELLNSSVEKINSENWVYVFVRKV